MIAAYCSLCVRIFVGLREPLLGQVADPTATSWLQVRQLPSGVLISIASVVCLPIESGDDEASIKKPPLRAERRGEAASGSESRRCPSRVARCASRVAPCAVLLPNSLPPVPKTGGVGVLVRASGSKQTPQTLRKQDRQFKQAECVVADKGQITTIHSQVGQGLN